jgi:hypothetical protein
MRLTLSLLFLTSLVACGGPSYKRGSDDPDIDEPAMSTRLDRADLDEALDRWYEAFSGSPFVAEVIPRERKIAILRIDNDTSEHIGSALRNLIDGIETKLVNDRVFEVVSNDLLVADAITQERLRDLGESVDPETVAALGKEFGIQYFVHGRVGETTEKTQDTRRVQYFLFLKVTEVATTQRVFQLQIPITKQIED